MHTGSFVFTFLLLLILSLTFIAPVFAKESDDLQEADKLYMQKNKSASSELTEIDKSDITMDSLTITDAAQAFPFEQRIADVDAEAVYQDYQKTVTAYRWARKTVKLSDELHRFLQSFTDGMTQAYVSQTSPDVSSYFDTSNQARKENLFLTEAAAYRNALLRVEQVNAASSSFLVYNMEKDGNVLTVDYRVITTLRFSDRESDERFAFFCNARIIRTQTGWRIIRFWQQDFEFVNTHNKLTALSKSKVKSAIDRDSPII